LGEKGLEGEKKEAPRRKCSGAKKMRLGVRQEHKFSIKNPRLSQGMSEKERRRDVDLLQAQGPEYRDVLQTPIDSECTSNREEKKGGQWRRESFRRSPWSIKRRIYTQVKSKALSQSAPPGSERAGRKHGGYLHC